MAAPDGGEALMDKPLISAAPGLRWRKRARGWVPMWLPSDAAAKLGYPCGVVNLEHLDPADIADRCRALQADMNLWLAGYRKDRLNYQGTIASILDIYETHPESPLHSKKPGTRHPYQSYLRRLRAHIGGRVVASVVGPDVTRWHKTWIDGNPPKLAAGAMALSVLKSALSFGAYCGYDDCARLLTMLREGNFAQPKPRTATLTAAHVEALRKAAHANGAPSRALAYALQFETTLRQWDVKGQWYPIDYPILSAVVHKNLKWVGLMWSHIDENMILRYRPSKTEHSSGEEVAVDLTLCPMVLEELAHVLARTGPVVINERTGAPFLEHQFGQGWRLDRRAAGISPNVWNRDLRASGITEGRSAGATTDDAAKIAGHSDKRTTARVYDRSRLEAARRFARARTDGRDKA
jgi:hypothetical protein